MTEYMFLHAQCVDLTKCCKVKRVHDSTKWGHIRFLELKNPSDPTCSAQLQQALKQLQVNGGTVITPPGGKGKGLYIIHCPHPPCAAKGKTGTVNPALF